MSRVGKSQIQIPQGVEVTLAGRDVTVKGKLGQMQFSVPSQIEVKQEDNVLNFVSTDNSKTTNALWGTSRARVANMVKGVSEGFTKKLQVVGVGYRAAVQGRTLDVQAGYSHPVKMEIPEGLNVQVNDQTEIVVTGYDRHAVGQFAANIRAVREPEPYKGKGIRYVGEQIVMKEGKKK